MKATREQFLAAKCKSVDIPAPELGEGVKITVVEPDDDAYEALWAADYQMDASGRERLVTKGRAIRWAIACVRNEDGTPMFTEADAAAMKERPGGLLDRILVAALRMTQGRNPVEDAAKNS